MNQLGLWPHQLEAVRHCEKYFKVFEQNSQTGSALIQMPTGSGKTGVIAALACNHPKLEKVLLVSPSKAIRRQLCLEVREAFWKKLGIPSPTQPYVREFTPSSLPSLSAALAESDRWVLLTTVQSLALLRKNSTGEYSKLKGAIDLVLFDEGHREPALTWAQAIRGLEKPTVLFSATPYRNDFAFFDIDQKQIFHYAIQKAEGNNFVRPVEFEKMNFIRDDAESFVQELLARLSKGVDQATGVRAGRVIIRCSNHAAIRKVVHELEKAGQTAVGIHDQFKTSGSLYRYVPPFEDVAKTFWVHQHKLSEGIDDPRFAVLALFQRLGSTRALVQQVGRIIRNPNLDPTARALVLHSSSYRAPKLWSGYLEFEKNGSAVPAPKELLAKMPGGLAYFDGDFRRALNLNQPDVHLLFKYRRTVNVLKVVPSFSFEDLVAGIENEWWKFDRFLYKTSRPEPDTAVIPFISVENSPVLLKEYFLEPKVGFTFVKLVGSNLYFRDTGGRVPKIIAEEATPADPSHLSRLFSGPSARASSVSLINTDIGGRSVRRRSLHAHSILETAPRLSDHMYFCSTLNGYVKASTGESHGRYVGFTRGRISDRIHGECQYDDFIDWINLVETQLTDQTLKANVVLERFAEPVGVPNDPTPRHILLDIKDLIDDEAFVRLEDNAPLELAFLAREVQNGSFKLIANDKEYEVGIKFVRKSNRYKLFSDELRRDFISVLASDRTKRSLLQVINQTQAIRVVPKDGWTIYSHAKFYRPRHLKHISEIKTLFVPTSELDNIASEKGTKKQLAASKMKANWPSNSLFRYLDEASKGSAQSPLARDLQRYEHMVCDDMDNEVADFIVVSPSSKSVAFIHCKTGGPESASDFQEVCGQALKNLEALSPYGSFSPPNMKRWDSDWRKKVSKRIRKGSLTGQKIWETVLETVNDPSSTREVWLVYGGFHWQRFEAELSKNDPGPVAVQLVYLLRSVWGTVASIGARLRIFCPLNPS